MFEATIEVFEKKSDLYQSVHEQLRHMLDGEHDLIANASNASSLIFHAMPDLNWAGFYFYRSGELIVGPFQGKPACVHIAVGKGVCGTAAAERRTVVVKDVHAFPGHIACDSASNSEIVVPMIKNGNLMGVLDIDSPMFSRFDDDDQVGLEKFVEIFSEATDFQF